MTLLMYCQRKNTKHIKQIFKEISKIFTCGKSLTCVASFGWLYFLLAIKAFDGLPQTTRPKVKSLMDSSVAALDPKIVYKITLLSWLHIGTKKKRDE